MEDTEKLEQKIISDYFRKLANKSHEVVKKKYGSNHYRNMAVNRWDKDKIKIKLI